MHNCLIQIKEKLKKNLKFGVVWTCETLCGPATVLKVTLHGWFLRFLNCTGGTKSRKVSHMSYDVNGLPSDPLIF